MMTVNNKEITISYGHNKDLIYSYAYYILIINAENIANCKSQNFLLLLSSILFLNNDLCTGRQTERRRRELKTAVKSNGQIAL